MCVRERERERESVWCVCLCVREREREREEREFFFEFSSIFILQKIFHIKSHNIQHVHNFKTFYKMCAKISSFSMTEHKAPLRHHILSNIFKESIAL